MLPTVWLLENGWCFPYSFLDTSLSLSHFRALFLPSLSPSLSSPHSYLYACACFQLDRLSEAEAALLPYEEGLKKVLEKGPVATLHLLLAQVGKEGWREELTEGWTEGRVSVLCSYRPYAHPFIYSCLYPQPSKVPEGAAGLHLLGRICQRANRPHHAREFYRCSLQVGRGGGRERGRKRGMKKRRWGERKGGKAHTPSLTSPG